MRTLGTITVGVAGTALALAACAAAVSSSAEIPAGSPAPVLAQHAPAAATISDRDALAPVKRHLIWPGGDPGIQRMQADASSFTTQADLVQLKRYIAARAAERAQGS